MRVRTVLTTVRDVEDAAGESDVSRKSRMDGMTGSRDAGGGPMASLSKGFEGGVLSSHPCREAPSLECGERHGGGSGRAIGWGWGSLRQIWKKDENKRERNKIKIHTVLTTERDVKDAVVVGENGDAQACIRGRWPAGCVAASCEEGTAKGRPWKWVTTRSASPYGNVLGVQRRRDRNTAARIHTTSSGRGALWR
jgi:hypothetical protein